MKVEDFEEKRKAFLEYLGTIEAEAVFTIYQKYKRSMGLKHSHLMWLHEQCAYIFLERKQKKEVNVNYLIQELGNRLKNLNIKENES